MSPKSTRVSQAKRSQTAVRAHDRVHVGGPRAARPRGIRAIARPFAIARNAVRFHGKTSIGIWEVLQNRAGDHSTIGETSPTRGNTSRGVSGPPVIGSGAAPKRKGYTSTSALFTSNWTG